MVDFDFGEDTITKRFINTRYQISTTAKRQNRNREINKRRLSYLSQANTQSKILHHYNNQFANNIHHIHTSSFNQQPYTYQQQIPPPTLMGITQEQFVNMLNINIQPTPTLCHQMPTQIYYQKFKTPTRIQKVPQDLEVKNCNTQFNRQYDITSRVLGEGSESIVYEGVDKLTKTRVAIKVLTSHYTDNEINIMKSMRDNENILKMYDNWVQKGKMFIVLQLCQGNLQDLKENTSLRQRYSYFKQILNGMEHLDRHGILHRDIKLYNILVKNGKVKLSDFGFAKHIGTKLAIQSRQCGTPATMAPEVYFAQERKKVVYDRKSDIWPLGVVLHELIYNCHPFNYDPRRMERGDRIKVNNPIPGIQNILNKILVTNTRMRISLYELVKMFEEFLRKESQPVLIKENIKQKERAMIRTPYKHQRQVPTGFYERNQIPESPLAIPRVIPNLLKRKLNQEQQYYRRDQQVFRNLRKIAQETKKVNYAIKSNQPPFSVFNLVKVLFLICLCVYIMRLMFN